MRRSWLLGSACALPVLVAFFAACGVQTSSESSVWRGGGDAGASAGGPGAAPTGQRWEGVESDEGCGREGVRFVLVDEICGKLGDGYDEPALTAPMFRDGALFGTTLLATDATFLWSLDLGQPGAIKRRALVGGLGTPTAAAAYGASTLLLAAGAEGLVRVDATEPMAPTRAGNVTLPGFAYDVHVDGDRAYVALGKAGLGVVDLTTNLLVATIPVPGFAVGVTSKGSHAFVAACKGLQVVDLDKEEVIGSAWPPASSTTRNGVLVAPAKDVTVNGDIAYVAAGRGGAVAIDVSSPEAPVVLGNCTRTEPSFYASGVRAADSKVYVAGGEWGVLPVPVAGCTTLSSLPVDPPKAGEGCSGDPPWELIPWQEIWAPPPPAKDPIQVLPVGDRVFAFGDARRIGTRAVDVRDPALALMNRYDEPRKLVAIGSSGGRVLAAGAAGGLFTIGDDGALTRVATADDSVFRAATAVGFTTDGRWVAAANANLYAEGRVAALAIGIGEVHSVVPLSNTEVAVATDTGIVRFDVLTGDRALMSSPSAHLPPTLAADGQGGVYVGAPEWSASRHVLANGTEAPIAAHGVFDDAEALDVSRWRTRLPRRHLTVGAEVVEVAGLGDAAGLTVHRANGSAKVDLPAATYAAAAAVPGKAFVLGIDRGLYRSTLVTVATAGAVPSVVSTEVFTGAGAGITVTQGRAYVADADGAIRTYDVSGAKPVLTNVLTLEESP